MVAVVGTRTPTREGEEFTTTLCHELATQGVVVSSGGALGIDSAAHRAALDRGRAFVVSPSGFQRPFPEENRELFRELVERGGGVVSEHDDQEPASRSVFFRRNALLVALADVLVVVEAPFRSGARNAAKWGRELGRPVYVVPHSPWNRRGSGWVEEHRLGAKLCFSSQDIFDELAALNRHAIPLDALGVSRTRQLSLLALEGPPVEKKDAPLELSSHEGVGGPQRASGGLADAVLAALSEGPLHLDLLVDLLRCRAGELHARVAELCLDGRASLNEAGLVSRAVTGSQKGV
jgi:DNA processing protein